MSAEQQPFTGKDLHRRLLEQIEDWIQEYAEEASDFRGQELFSEAKSARERINAYKDVKEFLLEPLNQPTT